jgi:hypothetical protein
MKKLLFLFLLIQINHCYCQKNSRNEKEALQFLLYIRDSLSKGAPKDTLFISGIAFNRYHNFTNGLNKYFLHSNIFSESEKKKALKEIADSRWVCLPDFSGNGVIVLYQEKWADHTVGHFNYPIFLKDFKYCIFAYSKPFKTNNPKAISNETFDCYLFQKNGKNWKPIEYIGEIDSVD